jgi:hypothetical protein
MRLNPFSSSCLRRLRRRGACAFDRTMIYAKGGAAFINEDFS